MALITRPYFCSRLYASPGGPGATKGGAGVARARRIEPVAKVFARAQPMAAGVRFRDAPGDRGGNPAARLRGRPLYSDRAMEDEDRLPQKLEERGLGPCRLPMGGRKALKRSLWFDASGRHRHVVEGLDS